MNSLIAVLVVLIIVGVAMALLPMDARIKQIVYIILAVILILWLLSFVGFLPRWDRVGEVSGPSRSFAVIWDDPVHGPSMSYKATPPPHPNLLLPACHYNGEIMVWDEKQKGWACVPG
jgi:hypothetical protein